MLSGAKGTMPAMAPFTSFRVTGLLMRTSLSPRVILCFLLMAPTAPAIGNGRMGVVVPALGLGATPSFMAGLYENAPGDVPRIAALPSWTEIPTKCPMYRPLPRKASR